MTIQYRLRQAARFTRLDADKELLAENPNQHARRFVILDDDSDMLDSQQPHFVQTQHRDGFGVPEYLKALEILAPEHKDVTQLAWYAKDKPLMHQAPKLEWA